METGNNLRYLFAVGPTHHAHHLCVSTIHCPAKFYSYIHLNEKRNKKRFRKLCTIAYLDGISVIIGQNMPIN